MKRIMKKGLKVIKTDKTNFQVIIFISSIWLTCITCQIVTRYTYIDWL